MLMAFALEITSEDPYMRSKSFGSKKKPVLAFVKQIELLRAKKQKKQFETCRQVTNISVLIFL